MTASAINLLPVVHAVSDGAAACRLDFVTVAGRAMTEIKSRLAIHLRAPMLPGRMFFHLAEELARLQNDCGSWLIVNDRVDVARAVGAKGVQLTTRSLSVADARKVAGDIPVGASVHTLEEAIAAYDAGASWCVAGNVFPTGTHPGTPGKRVEFISLLASAVPIPIIAIGGVKPEDVPDLLDAGAYGIATIRGAGWNDEKSVAPLSNYIWEYDTHRSRTQRDLPDSEWNEPGNSG